jgi:N-glycosylase/DNA lyase
MAATEAAPPLDWLAIWHEFGEAYTDRVSAQAHVDLETELLFCLLGGHGVPYELAQSALSVLSPLRVFSPEWTEDALEATVRAALERPQFEPRRRDGSLRRYRYPVRKSQLIVSAVAWTRANTPVRTSVASQPDERQRRQFLCGCPGVGLKTASWLLRNVGLAQRLAVIDVHVLRALTDAGRIAHVSLPRDYFFVEDVFLDWCDELGAAPAAFDLLLWEWQRAI